MKASFNKKNPKKILGYLMAFAMVLFSGNVFSQCSHTFNAYDSYGDGWNGASVDVTVNGTTVVTGANCSGTIGTPTGSAEAFSFSASTGDVIDLTNWVSGSYNSEITWDITDPNGAVLAMGVYGGTGPATGNCVAPPLM